MSNVVSIETIEQYKASKAQGTKTSNTEFWSQFNDAISGRKDTEPFGWAVRFTPGPSGRGDNKGFARRVGSSLRAWNGLSKNVDWYGIAVEGVAEEYNFGDDKSKDFDTAKFIVFYPRNHETAIEHMAQQKGN